MSTTALTVSPRRRCRRNRRPRRSTQPTRPCHTCTLTAPTFLADMPTHMPAYMLMTRKIHPLQVLSMKLNRLLIPTPPCSMPAAQPNNETVSAPPDVHSAADPLSDVPLEGLPADVPSDLSDHAHAHAPVSASTDNLARGQTDDGTHPATGTTKPGTSSSAGTDSGANSQPKPHRHSNVKPKSCKTSHTHSVCTNCNTTSHHGTKKCPYKKTGTSTCPASDTSSESDFRPSRPTNKPFRRPHFKLNPGQDSPSGDATTNTTPHWHFLFCCEPGVCAECGH